MTSPVCAKHPPSAPSVDGPFEGAMLLGCLYIYTEHYPFEGVGPPLGGAGDVNFEGVGPPLGGAADVLELLHLRPQITKNNLQIILHIKIFKSDKFYSKRLESFLAFNVV